MSADPNRCPLFVELCAGTAALSLRLHHPRARPPVSRMGAKTGYADVILRCMGLRPGQGSADGTRYLWCEPDKGVRLLLHALTNRSIALAAAEVIASWKDEDPKALWLRLRAEGPAVCPPVDAREVARFLWVGQRAYRQGEPQSGGPVQIGDGGRWAQPLEESLPGAPTLPATITADARDIDPREVARFIIDHGWSVKNQFFRGPAGASDGIHKRNALTIAGAKQRLRNAPQMPATITADARDIDPREVARAARLLTANRLINLDPETWRNTGEGGTTHGGAEFCTDAAALADAVAGVPEVPGAVVDDARAVDPREVARWSLVSGWAAHGKDAGSYGGPGRCGDKTCALTIKGAERRYRDAPTLSATLTDDARAVDPREVARFGLLQGGCYNNYPIDVVKPQPDYNRFPPKGNWPVSIGEAIERAATIDATITDDARAVDPPQLPPGVVAYIDPPYLNTTGYAHAFPRSEWLPIVRRWAEAGALVVVSEAEPIPELMAEGWHAVEITGERKGQKRTFSKQQREWLTMSRAPAWKPSEQMGLFNGG